MSPRCGVEPPEVKACALLRGSRGVYLVETPEKELYIVAPESPIGLEVFKARLSGPEALLAFTRLYLDDEGASHGI